MSNELEILALRARVAELESRLAFLYQHLGIAYVENTNLGDTRVLEMLRKGNKLEAIKIYREIHDCGLAEAKQAVDKMEVGF